MATSEDEVYYMCKRTVVSTKPVQPNKFHQLSVLDRTMEQNHLRMVFYYRFMPSTTMEQDREIGELTKFLRESLSEMLTWLPIATGRLIRDEEGHWMIKCNDAGVRLVEARAKGSVENWLKNVDREKELKLIHWEEMFYKPYYWSTFYVQITEFEEDGLAIGLSCIHLLADPVCATMFIRAWADTTLFGKMKATPIFHPLPPRRPGNEQINHKPYAQLINHYKSSLNLSILAPNSDYKTLALSFSDQMVRACISMARAPGAQSEANPSPFEALAGLFWVCISRIKGIREGLVSMSISIDVRKVLGLDKGYFGNCTVYNRVPRAKGKTNKGKDGVIEASKAINEVVENMNTEGIMDLIEWLDRHDNKYHPSLNGNDLICANLETIEPYLVMFEDGCAPTRISCYVEPVFGEGQVLILQPPPPSDGPLSRMVMVTIADHEAAKLCEDDLILSLSPSILMGMNKVQA